MKTSLSLVVLASSMYSAYNEAVGGKAYNGDPLPSADEFFADESKKKQSDAWIAAAAAAAEKLEVPLIDADLPETSQKTLHNSDVSGAKENVSDLKVVGNGDMFQLLCKASSEQEGWMKSTKAMEVGDGCVVQVTTQQGNHVAEALTYVPRCKIIKDIGTGKKLTNI